MLPILQIGPLALQLPGLLLLLGVWLGTIMAERAAKRHRLSPAAISTLIFYALLGGILGARLGYVLRHLGLYLESPAGIIALNPQTLSLWDGAVTGALVALILGQRRGLPFWGTLDVLAPGFGVFAILLGFAHLASGDAFGAQSQLPWAIELWGARRHPTQIYEILSAGLILVLLQRLQMTSRFDGFLILAFSALTAFAQFLVEAFRGDSLMMPGGLRGVQLISLLILLGSLILLHFRAQMAVSQAGDTHSD